ncbi:B3 domain-containing protein At2g33720-like [Macadamia integrifolia]|uniref:B3 domain-containing protein At2g33720-like n=1 Tax=Macadamia integrifolia TaxID=60698 RepID=UPI001C4FB471|nr:B3 domain-containing protein At2g33720-like [Macadamia integrifolia]
MEPTWYNHFILTKTKETNLLKERKDMLQAFKFCKRELVMIKSGKPKYLHCFLPTKEEEEEFAKKPVAEIMVPNDGWTIKKVLTGSDVGHLSRLLLGKHVVEKFIFPYWDQTIAQAVEHSRFRHEVNVIDIDTMGEHKLFFFRWACKGSYILQGNWSSQFVNRRKLKNDDMIGMFWDISSSSLVFSVLSRSS